MKKALITWVTWQDWAYLAELLLEKWYEVHGLKRRSSTINTERIDHLYHDIKSNSNRFFLHHWDLTDSTSLIKMISEIQPDEIYNLAAQSHVKVSFEVPEYTANSDGIWVLRILEAIRIAWLEKTCKFYQASTSEMYGGVWFNMPETGYTETSLFYPRSPYGVAKLYWYRITVNYREAYWMYTCNGILFNHESPIRWETFVTRKITRFVAQYSLWIKDNIYDKLYLWNLGAKRDRGHAKDFVEGMRLMLQQEKPEDFVLATWETHSVREFVDLAFKEVWISIDRKWTWKDEKWYNSKTWECLIEIDPRYFRPTEVDLLLGDPTKAKKKLWRKPKYTIQEMVSEMVKSDIEKFKKQDILKKHGYEILAQYE